VCLLQPPVLHVEKKGAAFAGSCLLEETRHVDIVVTFLRIHACCVVPETKITTKACHTTNIHDLSGNLTIQTVKRTQHSYVHHGVLDFKILCKEGYRFLPFREAFKTVVPKILQCMALHGVGRQESRF
jgi:hypothetical protein